MIYATIVYNAQIDKAEGRPRLSTQAKIFLNGKEVFNGKEIPFDASNRPDLKRLPLAGQSNWAMRWCRASMSSS